MSKSTNSLKTRITFYYSNLLTSLRLIRLDLYFSHNAIESILTSFTYYLSRSPALTTHSASEVTILKGKHKELDINMFVVFIILPNSNFECRKVQCIKNLYFWRKRWCCDGRYVASSISKTKRSPLVLGWCRVVVCMCMTSAWVVYAENVNTGCVRAT